MSVDLEDRLSVLLAEHLEWMRLTDRFAPGTRVPLRSAELDDTLHSRVPAPRPAAEDFWAVPGVTGTEAAPVAVVPHVGELMQQYVALGERIAAIDPSTLDPGQALGEAQALASAQHTIRVMQLTRTKDVSERELFKHLGFRSQAAWQRTTAPDTPRSERTLSRRLGALPHLRAALSGQQVCFTAANQVAKAIADLNVHLDRPDGLIDGRPGDQVLAEVCMGALDLIGEHHFGLSQDKPEQAALLARLDAALGAIALSPSSQLDRLEQLLVLLATELPQDRLAGVLEDIRLQLRPSVLERQEREAQHSRDLKLKPNSDGTWDLKATLTPEVGEQLFTALAAEARRDPANPADTHAREAARDAAAQAAADLATAQAASAAAQAGDDDAGATVFDQVLGELLNEKDPWEARPLGTQDADAEPVRPRSRGQRLHDAAGRLLSRYLEQGLGGVSNKIPVQVTTVINERTIRGLPGAPPARGSSGRPLARSLIQRWWCDAKVTPLLMSDGWTPLGVMHSQRTITGIETKALRVQFGNRCPGIGCCTGQPDPLTPLIPHHVEMFSVSGTTSLFATLPCCEHLHADIHVGKKVIRLRDGSCISEEGYLCMPELPLG